MGQQKEDKDLIASGTAAGGAGGGVSLGKGAWDCDHNVEIPPEAEVGVHQSPQILVLHCRRAGLMTRAELCGCH